VRGGEGDEHGIARTWAMRGTLHLVAAEDVPLTLAIFAPCTWRAGSAA
jgi:hypothetical protein